MMPPIPYPAYWKNIDSPELTAAVQDLIFDRSLTPTQIALLQAYIKTWVEFPVFKIPFPSFHDNRVSRDEWLTRLTTCRDEKSLALYLAELNRDTGLDPL